MSKDPRRINSFDSISNDLDIPESKKIQTNIDDNTPQLLWLSVADIVVLKQDREEFEDEENTIESLADSIKSKGLLQPILVRPGQFGKYELVAGERRLRAHKLIGLLEIPAFVKILSSEEAEDAQFAENIHRKNLTQIEEAKKIQRDLDKLGSVQAVLKKHQKNKSWLSKMMSLLDLPEQTKRLVSENISADVEIITQIKTIEKIDPVKAKEIVDKLKSSKGKVNARELVAVAKDEVKPSTKLNTKPGVYQKAPTEKSDDQSINVPEPVIATKMDKAARLPSAVVSTFPSLPTRTITPGTKALNIAFSRVFTENVAPENVVLNLTASEKGFIEEYLRL